MHTELLNTQLQTTHTVNPPVTYHGGTLNYPVQVRRTPDIASQAIRDPLLANSMYWSLLKKLYLLFHSLPWFGS